MELPGKRIQRWREYLGKSPKEFEVLTGIPYSTLKTLENNTDPDKVKPSYEVLAKLRRGCPELNIDWIFDEGDTEPMLKEGRTLTRTTPALARPVEPQLAINRPTPEEWAALQEENRKLREQLAANDGKLSAVEEDRNWLRQFVKKDEASADAASLFETVDAIEREFRYAAEVEVPEIPRFVPARRQAFVPEPVGFRLQHA